MRSAPLPSEGNDNAFIDLVAGTAVERTSPPPLVVWSRASPSPVEWCRRDSHRRDATPPVPNSWAHDSPAKPIWWVDDEDDERAAELLYTLFDGSRRRRTSRRGS